jgi:hypothetical protein
LSKKNFQINDEDASTVRACSEADMCLLETACLIKANEAFESDHSDQFESEHAAILHEIETLERLVANLKAEDETLSQYDNELTGNIKKLDHSSKKTLIEFN